MKKCGKCKAIKSIESFYKNKRAKDGLDCQCKVCKRKHWDAYRKSHRDEWNAYQRRLRLEKKENDPEAYAKLRAKEKTQIDKYRATPVGRAGVMWSGILHRVKHKYEGIEVRFTRSEFIEWAIPKVLDFMISHPYETPSLDRIESSGHYEFGNIRVISLDRNVIRSSMLLKKLKLTEKSDQTEVLEKLSMAVFSVCSQTGVRIDEFAKHLLEISNENYLYEDEVI